jgi:hypothetical protein
MTESTFHQLTLDQQLMTKQASRLVIGLSAFIHLLIFIYSQMSDDSFLKIEVPVMSAVTFITVLLIFRMNKKAH